ncbi:trigger factor [bacterium]|nr:MAG: trigger factor [bacterium]
MEIDIQSPKPYLKKITIRLTPEEVAERYNQMLKLLAKQIKMPGFRAGKVPRAIIEKNYGETIISDLAEDIAKKGLEKALTENNIKPVLVPRTESELKLELGKEFVVDILVEVKPAVEIREYKGLPLTREEKPVTDEDIDKALEELRYRNGHLEPVGDRVSRVGDYVLVDFLPEGEEKATKRVLKLDDVTTVTALGRKTGETFEGHFEFPDDWPDTELAGNIFDATVTILELKEMVLPDIEDEEFLSHFGEEVKNSSVLREMTRKDIKAKLAEEADRVLHEKACEELVARNPVEISPYVIEAVIHETIRRYWDIDNLDEEQLKEITTNLRPRVVREMSIDLLLDRIAELEEVTIDDDSLKEYISRLANKNNLEPEALYRSLKKDGQLESVRGDLVRERALDIVIENAEITEL